MVTVTHRYIAGTPVKQALDSVFAQDVGFDLRPYLRFDTAPIAVVRSFADSFQLGVHTTLFGEDFERAVANNAYRFDRWRNKRASVDLYARLLQIVYVHTFTFTGVERTGVDICISQVLGTALPASAVQAEVRRAIEWLMTDFDTVTVSFCADAPVPIGFYTAGYAKSIWLVRD